MSVGFRAHVKTASRIVSYREKQIVNAKRVVHSATSSMNSVSRAAARRQALHGARGLMINYAEGRRPAGAASARGTAAAAAAAADAAAQCAHAAAAAAALCRSSST